MRLIAIVCKKPFIILSTKLVGKGFNKNVAVTQNMRQPLSAIVVAVFWKTVISNYPNVT